MIDSRLQKAILGLKLFFLVILNIEAQESQRNARPILGEVPQKVEDEYLPEVKGIRTEVWVDSLTIPWTLKFLPNGDALVAQRPGSIVRIPNGSDEQVPYFNVPGVVHEVDAGLMAMA